MVSASAPPSLGSSRVAPTTTVVPTRSPSSLRSTFFGFASRDHGSRIHTTNTTCEHVHQGRSLGARAAELLGSVLFNSLLSIGVAWLTAFCYSFGNIFSGLAPAHQSHRAFLVATLMWVHSVFCCVVWISGSLSLFHLHLKSRPDRRAGAAVMLFKTFRRTFAWFLFSAAIVASIGYLFGTLGGVWRKYRLEIYTSALWNHSFLPVIDRAARHIYRTETVEGQSRVDGHGEPKLQTRRDRLRKLGLRHLSLLVFLVPIVYVHIVSLVGVATSTRFAAALTIGSLALKLAMQEAAKYYILRTHIRNTRAMALVVAVPTVLIDTQVRIVLLRFQSVQMALSTTMALAIGEVATRVAKAKWLARQIRQREATERSRHATVVHPASMLHHPVPSELDQWRAQMHKYHTTEVCADMYVEYLAIGCSSAITVIFGHHPQFLFRSEDSVARAAAPLLAQVGVEIVVDYVSCMAELVSGLERPGRRERAYFVVFFIAVAIINVNSSAILYLAY